MPSPSMVWDTSAHSVARRTFSKARYYYIQFAIDIFVVLLHITRGLGNPLFNKFTHLWSSGPAVNLFRNFGLRPVTQCHVLLERTITRLPNIRSCL